jgi:hypothetical protein
LVIGSPQPQAQNFTISGEFGLDILGNLGYSLVMATKWKRSCPGDYFSEDGKYYLWQIPGVYPPAWNVEEIATGELIVNGARTYADAKWIFEEHLQTGEIFG